jgi:hypothetical protein
MELLGHKAPSKPIFGRLAAFKNYSERKVVLQALLPGTEGWAPLGPPLARDQEYVFAGQCCWLPRDARLRVWDVEAKESLLAYERLGDRLRIDFALGQATTILK